MNTGSRIGISLVICLTAMLAPPAVYADIPPPNLDAGPAPTPPPPPPPVDTSIYIEGKYCTAQYLPDSGGCLIFGNSAGIAAATTNEQDFTNANKIADGFGVDDGENPYGTNYEACQSYLDECDAAVQNFLNTLGGGGAGGMAVPVIY